MSIAENLHRIKSSIPSEVLVVAVSKSKSTEDILKAYQTGHRDFGENRVQELMAKQAILPSDINWHMIGHLQTNKVKYITPFISLIHSVDSIKLLKEINKQGLKNNKEISVLIQVKIAIEATKFGMEPEQVESLIHHSDRFEAVKIKGIMGMSSFVNDKNQWDKEFSMLKNLYDSLKKKHSKLDVLSMGMTQDYQQAIAHGSKMVRIGRKIFGERRT